MTATKHQISW